MLNEPSMDDLAKLPAMHSTEKIPFPDKIVHEHFFFGSFDFYAVEFDGEDVFFGFTCLGDEDNAEWGCTSLDELKDTKIKGLFEIDCDPHWTPVPAREIPLIFNWCVRWGHIKEEDIPETVQLIEKPLCEHCKREARTTRTNTLVIGYRPGIKECFIHFLCFVHHAILISQGYSTDCCVLVIKRPPKE